MREEVTCDLEFLSDVACHLIEAGGKRVRPALVIASAALGADPATRASPSLPLPPPPLPSSPPSPPAAISRSASTSTKSSPPSSPLPPAASAEVISGAAAVELVHLGSLYHDDVMDSASTRRSVSSVNDRWDNLVAILAGDFLLARASQIAASLGTEVAGLLAATISKLCEGQIREHQDIFRTDRSLESYELSIEGKTAALLAASCRVGGIVAGLSESVKDALTDFGHSYGMAFQIVDDVLDVVATDEQLGKPAGADLAEGNYTLPVILALRTPAGVEMRRLLRAPPPLSPEDSRRAGEIIRSSSGIREALDMAAEWGRRATAAAAELGESPAAEALKAVSAHLLDRAHLHLLDKVRG